MFLLLKVMMISSAYYAITAIILCFPSMVEIEAAQQLTKLYERSLTISSGCSDSLQARWFVNGGPAPSRWVQSNGDLALPASDWRAYGNISQLCDGMVTNIYEIYSLGESCPDCLYISAHSADICVGDILNITVSTNRSEPHKSPFTLHVNHNACDKHGGGDGLVKCREEDGDLFRTTFSYQIKAIGNGMATLWAQTIYYGAEWSSPRIALTIRECDIPDGDTNNGTNVTVIIPGFNMSTQTPTPTPQSRDDDNNFTTPTPRSTPPTLPTGESTDESDGIKIVPIILGASAAVVVLLLLLMLLAFLWWKKHKKKKKNKISQELSPDVVEAVPHQVTPDDQMSLHQQEYSTVLAGGPQEVMSLPPRQHVWHPPG